MQTATSCPGWVGRGDQLVVPGLCFALSGEWIGLQLAESLRGPPCHETSLDWMAARPPEHPDRSPYRPRGPRDRNAPPLESSVGDVGPGKPRTCRPPPGSAGCRAAHPESETEAIRARPRLRGQPAAPGSDAPGEARELLLRGPLCEGGDKNGSRAQVLNSS